MLPCFFTPLYLLFMQNLEWLPEAFEFVAVRDTVNIPLIFQFLLLELSIDGLRLAAMNTPTMLSTPLSVIAGIVMGEFSVQSGWFNSEVMLYMAFVAVANYTQPNFELGYALKFMRLMLLVLTSLFNLYGFVAGCILVLCFLAFNKTLSGRKLSECEDELKIILILARNNGIIYKTTARLNDKAFPCRHTGDGQIRLSGGENRERTM